MTLTIKLRDINREMATAWEEAFDAVEGVEVSQGDIFGERADAIVSPANSFGFMDGGIDMVYTRRFGWGLSKRLRAHLAEVHHGELPVGQAVIIPTGDVDLPWMISAPTMRVPGDVAETVHAYLAFRAVLRSVEQFNAAGHGPIRSILCPGLCTAVGRMPFRRAARQMRHAHDVCLGGKANTPASLTPAVREHASLLR
jgi:O-acetyl-ADP-ribose deacetylase (regulator of RNase III)